METTKFDIADYLDNKEMVAEYLNAVLEDGDQMIIIKAIGYSVKAIDENDRNGRRNQIEQTEFI